MRVAKTMYRKYPNLQQALSRRNAVYNQTMDLIGKMEEEGYDIAMKYISDICH